MKAVKPLRSLKDVSKLKNYFLERKEYRNYLLVTVCLNTALRISDVLNIRWHDFKNKKCKTYLELNEKKTGKQQSVYINNNIKTAVKFYMDSGINVGNYVFSGRADKPISRVQVHKIIKRACCDTGIPDISCHSLRKTFGYHAWKKGTQPAVIMAIYNHSNFNVTKRYLGIVQEDKDAVFKEIKL